MRQAITLPAMPISEVHPVSRNTALGPAGCTGAGVRQGGKWFLIATCEIPEKILNAHPVGFVGVDLGIVNIAATSDGERHSGRRINRKRTNDRALRSKLQKKGTKSAKRRAKKYAGKEARRNKDLNHN
jgi:putative transposase